MHRLFSFAFALMTACSSGAGDAEDVASHDSSQNTDDDKENGADDDVGGNDDAMAADDDANTDDNVSSADDDVPPADDDTTTLDDDVVASDDDAPQPDDDVLTPMLVEPANHRAERETCDDVRPPGNLNAEFYDDTAPCLADEDCVDGINGRCQDLRGPACTYDTCFSDSECDKGPCGCEMGFWSDSNACLGGNCQIDADCGEGGYCSPSLGSCGAYAGVVAYWCRTATDTCVEDSECSDPNMGAGYCAYLPEVGYWSCQYGQCVG